MPITDNTWEFVATIFCSILASSGFWAYLQKKRDNSDAASRMLLGLAHDRITWLGMKYIQRGWITQDEYENIEKYLYRPYKEMHGNGTAERIMNEVKELPMKPSGYRGPSDQDVTDIIL